MLQCLICPVETVRDDVVLQQRALCVCLGGFARPTAGTRPLPTALRRDLRCVLAESPDNLVPRTG